MSQRKVYHYIPLLCGSYLTMFFCGSFTTLRGALLPKIMDHFQISYSAGGLMFLLVTIPGMLGSLSAGYIFNTFNKKRVLLIGIAVIGLGTFLMPLSPVYAVFLLVTVVFSFGLSLSITSGNITTSDTFDAVLPKLKENGINLVHFSFSLGTLLPLIVLSFAIDSLSGWQLPFLLLSIVPFIIFVLYLFSRYPSVQKTDSMPGRKEYLRAIRHPQLQRYILIVICYAGTEAAIINWLPTYIIDGLHLSAERASRVLLFFFIFFTLGRFLGTVLIHKFNRHRLFLILAVMMLLLLGGSLLFGIRPFGMELLIPFSGFFFAVVFPIFQMNLIEDFNHMLGSATSLLFSSSTAGITTIPFLIGIANDFIGVQYGILITLLTVSCMFPLYYFILRWKRYHAQQAGGGATLPIGV